ncbi:ABC transporter related protein [Clostridium carboxidivorans P7]|uniref:ABC transporter related protein n=1 Tax=Clostridium carboxidivorans P7 TaxID=536227 RepID=C6PW38_9CLOT|nr:ABC transporter ATP-binding protein [Clostridium carboxidivorans]EET86517.1 ABC transporter related protein [Clostridium carboxidivorans P7]
MSYFQIKNLSKKYDSNTVLDKVNLNIEKGTFLSLLGPSGCGKTTTLRIVAGFESSDEGDVIVEDKVINKIPVYKRNVGMVFQSYALFPHMNIEQNIAYGLEQRKVSKSEIKKEVSKAIEMVQLTGLEKRKPKQLSGGQQQRVALARALVIKPSLLLLDESLSALDKKLRVDMQVELRQIQKKVGITTIFVTHDQEEALTMSDKIAVMNKGKIMQLDTPHNIYERPINSFVAGFLGQSNFFKGVITDINNDIYSIKMENGHNVNIETEDKLNLNQNYIFSN